MRAEFNRKPIEVAYYVGYTSSGIEDIEEEQHSFVQVEQGEEWKMKSQGRGSCSHQG